MVRSKNLEPAHPEATRCRDGMLWIGQSYFQIECDQKPVSLDYCCQIDGKPQRCYVHEAELRGCCRKVAAVPEWIVPGKSRIFLVHHGDHGADRARGSLFGYFVVRRVEIITNRTIYEDLTKKRLLPWTASVDRDIMSRILDHIEKLRPLKGGDRKVLEKIVCDQFDSRWKPEELYRELGRGGVRPRSRRVRSWPAPSDPVDDEIELLEDILEECIKEWIKDSWFRYTESEDRDRSCALVPLSSSERETHRFCSKRLKTGATYLVDALTAMISDLFMNAVARKPLPVEEGEQLFRRIIGTVHARWRKTTLAKIDKSVKNYAALRGALVVFKKPYPTFERAPRAAFRGLLRVDGNKLLENIAQCGGKKECVLEIPYCQAHPGTIDPAVAALASSCGITKRTARALLALVGTLKHLPPAKVSHLPGIGDYDPTTATLRL